MRKKITAALILFAVLFAPAIAGVFDLHGYLKVFGELHEGGDTGLLQKARLSPEYAVGAFRVSASYELLTVFSRSSVFSSKPSRYRVADSSEVLLTAGEMEVYQNIDRCYLTVYTPAGDLYAGRQPVAWGSARLINPTDIFMPVSFAETDTDERPGVDSLRMRIPLGVMSEVDGGAVFGEGMEHEGNALFMRLRTVWKGADIALTGISTHWMSMAGIDVEGSLLNAGARVEMAYVFRDRGDYCRLTAGIDGNVADSVYCVLEYHYSTVGEKDPDDYVKNIFKQAYLSDGVYLMGRNYCGGLISWQAGGLVVISATVLCNADDGSYAVMPAAEYNIGRDVYLSAGGSLYGGIGGAGEFSERTATLYGAFRFYF